MIARPLNRNPATGPEAMLFCALAAQERVNRPNLVADQPKLSPPPPVLYVITLAAESTGGPRFFCSPLRLGGRRWRGNHPSREKHVHGFPDLPYPANCAVVEVFPRPPEAGDTFLRPSSAMHGHSGL